MGVPDWVRSRPRRLPEGQRGDGAAKLQTWAVAGSSERKPKGGLKRAI